MASNQLSMASDQSFLSSGFFNPITFSLLCPIAFSAYGSMKSMLPLIRSVASFPKSMPPLRRMVASSPEPMPPLLRSIGSSPKRPLIRLVAPSLIGLSAYRSFNSMPASSAYHCFNSMPTFSAHRCFNSIPPLLPPVASSPKSPLLGVAASSFIASYAYCSFNTMPNFSAYNAFSSMPPPIRPLTYRMPEKADTPSGPKSLGRKEKMDRLKEKVKTMDCGDIFTAGFLGIIWAPLMIHGIYETCRGL